MALGLCFFKAILILIFFKLLFKVIILWRLMSLALFVASKGKKIKKLTKMFEIEEVKIHIF